MWAVVGVYAGQEVNRLYERTSRGLKGCGGHVVDAGDVFVLGTDAIHAIENYGRQRTVGLHVDGGDLAGADNSFWGPDGRELSTRLYGAEASERFHALMEVAAEHGKHIDDDAWYSANTALREARERERRYPTSAETRRIAAHAWNLAP
jgi:hypothetical protein